MGKTGERWDVTTELLKGLAALLAGVQPVQDPGQGRAGQGEAFPSTAPAAIEPLSQGQLCHLGLDRDLFPSLLESEAAPCSKIPVPAEVSRDLGTWGPRSQPGRGKTPCALRGWSKCGEPADV